MNIAFVGRAEEISKIAEILKGKDAVNVMVDGKDSPIYALLRQMGLELSGVILRSGHVLRPSNADAIVEAVSDGEGIVPQGYHHDWDGKYYRVYFRNP